MSGSPVKFAVGGVPFTQPREFPSPRRCGATRVTAATALLCLTFLLAACGDDSSSTTSTSPPAELRDYPYCEVIPDTVADDILTEHIFNTLPFGPCPANEFATVTSQDVIDAYNAAYEEDSTSATINGPRHWVLDTLTPTAGGVTTSGDTLTVNGIEFGLVGELQTPAGDPTIGSDPFVVNTVMRNTIYVFKKDLLVFELTDPSGNVYVMQSYSQQFDHSLSLEKLPDINRAHELKEGWSYTSRRLTEDLTLTASGSTQIVNDYYRNTYQVNPAAN